MCIRDRSQAFILPEERCSVVERELDLAGYFCIVTSEKMSAKEAIELYKSRDVSVSYTHLLDKRFIFFEARESACTIYGNKSAIELFPVINIKNLNFCELNTVIIHRLYHVLRNRLKMCIRDRCNRW